MLRTPRQRTHNPQHGKRRKLKSIAVFPASLLAIIATLSQPANAPAAPSPAPASSAGASAAVCPLLVLGVVPIDAPDRTPAKEYAVALQAFDGPGSVSGTLSILADNRVYQVSFDNAIAVGRTSDSLKQLTPIVVQFPEAVTVNAAYVASMRGPNGGACEVAGAWINPEARFSLGLADVSKALKEKAPKTTPIPAGEPGPFVKPGCDSRATPVTATNVARADVPQLANLRQEGGDVYVEVVVDKHGSVATTWIWSTPYADLAGAALGAAKYTTYAPAQLDCTPITTIYIFVASFRV